MDGFLQELQRLVRILHLHGYVPAVIILMVLAFVNLVLQSLLELISL